MVNCANKKTSTASIGVLNRFFVIRDLAYLNRAGIQDFELEKRALNSAGLNGKWDLAMEAKSE